MLKRQIKRGKRLFNASCGQCHVGGVTKTNPNLGLEPDALSLATPPRDNINALIDYLKNQGIEPDYDTTVVELPTATLPDAVTNPDDRDEFYNIAKI